MASANKSRTHAGASWLRSTQRAAIAVAFLLPAIAIAGALRVWPMADAIWLSLTHWSGIGAPTFVGLENYGKLIHDPVFLASLRNNLFLVAAVPVWVALPYVVAVGLSAKPVLWRLFRICYFFPALLSPVVVGIFFSAMLQTDGPVNRILESIGLGSLAGNWLVSPTLAILSTIFVIIWASFGIGVLIFLAALGTVDKGLLDAAELDGAGWWQRQRVVVVWEILPAIEVWSVVVLISTFTAIFPLVYTFTSGGPGYSTYVIDYDIYQTAFQNGQFGYASALGVVLFVVVAALSSLLVWFFRRAEK